MYWQPKLSVKTMGHIYMYMYIHICVYLIIHMYFIIDSICQCLKYTFKLECELSSLISTWGYSGFIASYTMF